MNTARRERFLNAINLAGFNNQNHFIRAVEELAKKNKTTITQVAINKIINEKTLNPSYAISKIMEEILRQDIKQLLYGEETAYKLKKYDTTIKPLSIGKEYPLLSWDGLTCSQALNSMLQKKDFPMKFLPTERHYSSSAFCLIVNDDSMVCHDGRTPSFSKGDIILIEPETKVIPGNYVIARNKKNNISTFKQYVADAEGQWLTHQNLKEYPYKPCELSDYEIIGVVRYRQPAGSEIE